MKFSHNSLKLNFYSGILLLLFYIDLVGSSDAQKEEAEEKEVDTLISDWRISTVPI